MTTNTPKTGRGDSAARKVTLRKHSTLRGLWIASLGNRKVAVRMTEDQDASGMVPNCSSVAESFNCCSVPGDEIVDPAVIRLEIA